MSDQHLAFFIGLFGSVHCIGMCGPLAFAVPSANSGTWLIAFDKFMYQVGRIISYTILGLLIGFIGKQLWISGMQQAVSVLSGMMIILAATSKILKRPVGSKFSVAFIGPFNRMFSAALKYKANHLVIGMLNGILPCGFVYVAMAGAVNTGDVISSAEYMFWFGTGTLPLMLIATFSMSFAKPVFRRRINTVMPYLMLCLGVWFILKGMTLNIPYLSPAEMGAGVECR